MKGRHERPHDVIRRRLQNLFARLSGRDQRETGNILTARLLIAEMKRRGVLPHIHDAEFRVFSQYGEDGILQYLIRQTGIVPQETTFVEFGVANYGESNTRFLLMNDNWRGLVMDGSAANVDFIRRSSYYWRHELNAVQAFITAENIDELIARNGFSGPIGVLSIDIDGNDYWVWQRLSVVDPIIVVVEYNSTFGARDAVAVPYDAAFQRQKAHYSNAYWGASLKAFACLAAQKGYSLVGSNSAGNNAFFVRNDRLGGLPVLSVEDAHVQARFRDLRNADGSLAFLPRNRWLGLIADLPLVDVADARKMTVADLAIFGASRKE